MGLEEFESFEPCPRGQDAITSVLHYVLQQLTDCPIIVDDENTSLPIHTRYRTLPIYEGRLIGGRIR